MNLPGLITVQPDQTALIDNLIHMMGTCFREEMWYATWLATLNVSEDRKLAITQAAIRADYEVTLPYGWVYALDDCAGAANALLRSELGKTSWTKLEEQSGLRMAATLGHDELEVLIPRAEAMDPLSDTNWPFEHAARSEDFIYFSSIGIDPSRRKSGAFRRLITPFLAYADSHDIAVYLDCYTDRLEQLYGHFGFTTIERKTAPGFDLVERCMMRPPR